MKEQFSVLFDAADELKRLLSERTDLKEKQEAVEANARNFFESASKHYQDEQKKVDDLIEQAETEKQAREQEIIELTKKQFRGRAMADDIERLNRLNAEAATHYLKTDALKQLKEDVVISADVQRTARAYIRESESIGAQIQRNERAILNHLATLKYNGETLATRFDPVISGRRSELVKNIFAGFDNMRKEKE